MCHTRMTGFVCVHAARTGLSLCFIVLVYYCRTYYKADRVGEEDSGGHVLLWYANFFSLE
jgi:hypothetical protein